MIDAKTVHETLRRFQLADGMPMVLDLSRSHGAWLVDARTGEEFLDFFTCFATWPIGFNHPRMSEPGFREELHLVAAHNPSNSDLYTEPMARFVETFATRVTPPGFPHHFWVAGGALAVENALKAAFDWKARRTASDGADLAILHFREAFHGRSGYTLSLTNTERNKVDLFPKFDWPRVSNPKITFDLEGQIASDVEALESEAAREIEAAFDANKDRIAAIIIEPIQCEGGDNHFRPEFFRRLRRFADDRDCLLIFDEVQTGFFTSGAPWMWQHHGVAPDIVAFGKKTQVCGIYASGRLDEVEGNVFQRVGRINSTWGGNLVDMVRCRQFIEIITAEKLADNAARQGERFVRGLRTLARDGGAISNVRGKGCLVAFDLPSTEARDRCLLDLRAQKLLALKAGQRAIRFRPPLNVREAEIEVALERIAACLRSRVRA